MKKLIIFLCCIFCLSEMVVFAQRSAGFISQNLLYQEAKSMYDNRNYAGCINKLLEYEKIVSDPELIQEADFLLAASSFYTGKKGVELDLKYYLDNYPVNRHRDEACFMIGSAHFLKEEYTLAAYWLKQSNLDNLSVEQQEDYAYRYAVSCLKTKKPEEAKQWLSTLQAKSKTYRAPVTYYLACAYFSAGDYEQASALFNTVKEQPDFLPDVLYNLVQINFAQGRYRQTIADGQNLLSKYPVYNAGYNQELNRMIGLSYYQEANYPKTIDYLSRAAGKTNTLSQEDLYILGLAYYYQQNYPKAIESWKLSNPGNNALGQNTNLLLGQAWLKQKNFDQALMSFQMASDLDFDAQAKEAALYNYAMLLHQNSVSAFGESVAVLENYLNAYPNSVYAGKVNAALVDVYLTTKNYQTALASIAKIKNPGDKILQARQKIYYYLGTESFTNGNYNEAIRNFNLAIAAGNYALDEKAQAIYWRGESYYKMGDYASAAKDYQACLATGNKSNNLPSLAAYGLAYCSFNQKQYGDAQNRFRSFVSSETGKTPILSDAYNRLGDCYFYNRQFNEAENAYNQATSISSSMGDYALFQKGYVQGLQKNYQGKIAQMNRLIADYPESPYYADAIYEKARAYVMLENIPSAIEAYQQLWERFPESADARKAGIQIGLLYFNANQPKQAAEAYKKVIAKYPGSEEAKVAIDALKTVYFEMNDVNGYAEYVRSLGGAVRLNATEQDSLTYFAAERFFQRNDIKQAQTAMQNYLKTYPSGAFNVNARYYLAQAYYQDKNYASAKQEFEKVLATGNNRFTEETLLRLSEIYYNGKEYEKALSQYDRLQNTAESKNNRTAGAMGVIYSASQLNKPNLIIAAASKLLKDESLDPNTASEAKYYRAKACLASGETALAEKDLLDLSKDTRTIYGAEAKYLLAQYYFDRKQTEKAKETVSDYIRQGTPHSYWLARSFLLMSDIYASEGDTLQARQYLESLQKNYAGKDDDIQSRINERLNK